MERYSGTFPLEEHLLVASTGMAGGKRKAEAEEADPLGDIWKHLLATLGTEGRLSIGGSLCGWNIFIRKKRGESIGETKCGKRTKLMMVADG